jgi:hypothetical protein
MPNPPVGIRNNNYLNVKNKLSDPWNDAGGKPSRTDEHGHAAFSSPAFGVRAGILQLRAYFLKHTPKRQTINAIISEWAPADDTEGSIAGNRPNDPSTYAKFVGKEMGVGVDDKLELFNPDSTIEDVHQLRALFYAMAANEIGNNFKVPDEDFNAGLELVQPGIAMEGSGSGEAGSSAAETSVAGAAPSDNIPATGFCLYLRRVREEQRDGFNFARTVGEYQCYWNGEPIADLAGQMAERNGPGDNTASGVKNHRRIEEGAYPLAVHDGGRYKTFHYAKSGEPLPGLAVRKTNQRTDILIHPCHHDHGYVSSIGCINPAVGLEDADSKIDLADSRGRVIAIIDRMKEKYGADFPDEEATIPDALLVIEGEP